MNDLKERAKSKFDYHNKAYSFFNMKALEEEEFKVERLPFSIRILLESVLRQYDGYTVKEEHIRNLIHWKQTKGQGFTIPFKAGRIILQDFTGVPVLLDLASMRTAMKQMKKLQQYEEISDQLLDEINPEVWVDLVVDHSVQVDYYGSKDALEWNTNLEFERNLERYRFLNWAQKAFRDIKVIPPKTGIVHQVNLEYLAQVIICDDTMEDTMIYPDTLVGTDSHTTMINGLGVLGWGVGGIEAEAGMLGQPSYIPIPEVIGVKLNGVLPEDATATDLALKVTQVLRQKGVVGKFVEFFGDGLKKLSLADRATLANMAPEYGATCGYFPVDEETLNYLKLSGRDQNFVELVRTYFTANQLFYDYKSNPEYSDIIELELSQTLPSLAGPKRPQDLIPLDRMKQEYQTIVSSSLKNDNSDGLVNDGSVVIAAITSCTNTSNPSVMIGAGLLAKNAVEAGLTVPAHVKTSLAPGSRVVSKYLEKSGLQDYLDQLGFQVIGYGCTTCIGNSGPLPEKVSKIIADKNLQVASVLSGNRNFEGRIHSQVKLNYLASPMLVVAYALAGTINIDMMKEPIGINKQGQSIFLKDIWPKQKEIDERVRQNITSELFLQEYANVYTNNPLWNSLTIIENKIYPFQTSSTYIQNPPFFTDFTLEPEKITSFSGLRVLAKFGDSITTDHISPAGSIRKDTPAGRYLLEHGVQEKDFNTYGSRRGNHEVMMRGTFANIRIRNLIAPGVEGGYTTYWPTGEIMPIFDACMKYKEKDIGLIVTAGKDYGMGSSRDWAAKGPYLLGVKAIIAESYERIHRSNLVMMGVLPLQFMEGDSAESLGLVGEESYEIILTDEIKPKDLITVKAWTSDDHFIEFQTVARFDSEIEIDYYRHGGILKMVLRQKLTT